MKKDLEKLRIDVYDLVEKMYGDEYKYIDIKITVAKEKPKTDGVLSFRIDTDMMKISKEWLEIRDTIEEPMG